MLSPSKNWSWLVRCTSQYTTVADYLTMWNFVMLPLESDLCHISLLLKCKFLEIQFNQNSQPDGGKIYTFLLEKVSQFYDFFKALLLNCFY